MLYALALLLLVALGAYLVRRNTESAVPTSLPVVRCDPSRGGVHHELPPYVVRWGSYVDARNLLWLQGKFSVRPGLEAFGQNVAQRPMGFCTYDTATETARLTMATDKSIWRYDAGNKVWVDLAPTAPATLNPLSGGPSDQCVMRVFEYNALTYLLVTNGKDVPKKWDGDLTHTYVNVVGAPVARCMGVVANRAVLGNILSESAQTIDSSDTNNADSGWGGSNIVILGDTPGPIVAIRELGNLAFAVYKSDAIYIGQATGAADAFSYSLKAAYCSGPASPNAVISTADGAHMYLAHDGGVYRFDGAQLTLLGEQTRSYVADKIDPDRISRTVGFFDARYNVAWFLYPQKAVNELRAGVMVDVASGSVWPMNWAVGMSAATQVITASSTIIGNLPPIGQMTMTIGELAKFSAHCVFADATGQVYLDNGYTDNGAPIAFSLETGTNDFADLQIDPQSVKVVTATEHLFDPTIESQLVSVDVGATSYGESPVYEGPQTFDLQTGGPFELGHRISGRSIALKISGLATQPIEWRGSGVSVAVGGRR